MNCAEVNQKIELFVLGGLSKSEQVAISAHLTICPACNATEAEYRLLVTKIKEAAGPPPLRLDLVRRVRSAAYTEIRSIALCSFARRIIATTLSLAACLLFAFVIWRAWIWEPAPLRPSSIVWRHKGALSIPGSMADEIVVHGQNMYLLQESSGRACVAALDIKTGKQKWLSDIQMDLTISPRLSAEVPRPVAGAKEPQGCGYLLADDWRVYCLAPSEAEKFDLVALDAANGKKIWKYPQNQPESLKSPCKPTLLPTGCICWTTNTLVHMLSCANGKPLWTRSIPDGGLLSTAVVTNNDLYVTNAIGLYCLNITTGDETWRLAYGDGISGQGRPLLAAADGEMYAALNLGIGSRLFSIALKEQKILWHKDVARVTHLYASGDILYLRDQDVQALDRTTGQLLWTYPATGCNPVTYAEGLAYFVDSSDQGRLIALDRYTGKAVWELAGMRSCNAFIKVDSTGFVKTHDGVVYAIIFKG